MTDPRLRFRIYVDGQLAAETWLDCLDADASELAGFAAEIHAEITNAADRAGRKWLTEVYDPDQPEDRAYLRFGTDTRGMTEPRPVETIHLPE